MQSLILAASVAGLSAYALPSNATVTASPNIVYTTEVVTALTTYCPASTTLTFNSKTYTVTSATTLTITDCPCTVHKPVPTGHAQDECAKKCSNALFECKAKPDANQSSCVSEYNSCLGFQAIGGGKADYYPSACSKGDNPPAPTGTGHNQDECAKKCSNALFECKAKPDANQSSCVSEYNSCLGFQAIGGGKADYYPSACSKGDNPPAPTGTGHAQDECAKKCSDALFDCKSKPDANQSTCVSNYNSCLGFQAIGGGKADYYPTACSKEGNNPPAPTGTGHAQDDCLGFQAIGDGKADYYPTACSKEGNNPPAPTGTGHAQDECAKKCSDALFDCKSKPDANQSTCVSNYNSCLGFQAIGDGKADYYPAACSKEGNTPAPTGTPGQGQGQTPPSGQGQTPPSGQGQTPPSGQGQTPPSGQGQTPPSGQGQTPPSGQGQTPPAGQGQGQDECAKKCVAALGDCKAQPGANQSFCVSSYNNCLGYEAIGGGKADYSPSACAPKATGTGATAVPTVPVTVGAAGIVRPVSLFVLGAVLLL
ncbi:hypothetical protein MY4038_009590 [Beauveria bassiana]